MRQRSFLPDAIALTAILFAQGVTVPSATAQSAQRVLVAAQTFPPPAIALVKDINSGTLPSSPIGAVAIGSLVYFWANDQQHGTELWKTDGSAAGTTMVKDITPGPSGTNFSSSPRACGGKLAFTNEASLWLSDGTAAGTNPLTSQPGPNSSNLWVGAAFIYFFHYSSEVTLTRINCATGQSSIVAVLPPGTYSVIDEVDGRAYLRETKRVDMEVQLSALWRTDGTPDTTLRIWQRPTAATFDANIGPIGPFSELDYSVVHKGSLYLFLTNAFSRASTTPLNEQLYRINAQSDQVSLLKSGIHIVRMASTTQDLLFLTLANNTATIWRSDGTSGGTVPVTVLAGASISDRIDESVAVTKTMFFEADTAPIGRELWKTDGTAAGTRLVKDIAPGPADGVDGLSYLATPTQLVFRRSGQLWRSDGTETGTRLVKVTFPGENNGVESIVANGDKVFFSAHSPESLSEFWVTDGTEAGTQLLKDINTAPGDSWPELFGSFDNQVYFSATRGPMPLKLWRSDGTSAGTELMLTTDGVEFSTHPRPLIAGPALFTWARDPVSFAASLHSTASGATGTLKLKEFSSSTNASMQVAHQNRLHFSIEDGLWRSDGTVTGTLWLSGSAPLAFATGMVSLGNALFVQSPTTTWKLEEGPSGAAITTATLPNSSGVNGFFTPLSAHISNTRIYVVIDEAQQGLFQVWRSDGTIAGSYVLTTIVSPNSWVTLQTGESTVGFAIGNQFWTTDGTIGGTQLKMRFGAYNVAKVVGAVGGTWLVKLGTIDSLSALTYRSIVALDDTNGAVRTVDEFSSIPDAIVSMGDHLYFAMTDPAIGNELFRMRASRNTDLAASTPALVGSQAGSVAVAPVAVTNVGAARPQAITLTAQLAPGLTYLSDSSGVTPTVLSDTVSWVLPGMSYLALRQFDLRLQTASAPIGTRLPFTISVNSSGIEDMPADNTAAANVMIGRPTFLPWIGR